ncbi:TerD family protein [Streptomyces sp. TRM66268-LWL]|uniref:TerD family protein n=1 Tax=Streptomyces polyasparticus TaxID=2767826 RepID=A0ABR7SS56_9ACTN|nr:TerD family protein [Streptomyces polyasparticus]MBC9718341.1 TerD family protein [Streptomyces polyasparticus]
MSSFSKGLTKVEAGLKWDPAPTGGPKHDLDLVCAVYEASDPHGKPDYLVHFGSRSPDGTITLNRDSQTGQGFGYDEVMTLELNRLNERYVRVVLGVAIQQTHADLTFGETVNSSVRLREGHTDLAHFDFAAIPQCTAAVLAEFTRDGAHTWQLRPTFKGFELDPTAFALAMGAEVS